MTKLLKTIRAHRLVFVLMAGLMIFPMTALALDSANYEIIDGGTDASQQHNSTSANFRMEGSVEYMVGDMMSASWNQETGSPLPSNFCGDGEQYEGEDCDGIDLNGATCTSEGFASGVLACDANCVFDTSACVAFAPGGGGGGGGPGPLPTVTIDPGVPILTYLSSEVLAGTRSSGSTVFVNDNSAGIDYPTSTTWQIAVALSLGGNYYEVYATNSRGGSGTESITITRVEKPFGDVNGDNLINDYDLSLLAYYWGTSYGEADFNADGNVDDYDLSIMAAYWDIGA